MALEVIGAGWGRTGTLSLKVALETLGFGPCYHMSELLKRPVQIKYWEKLHGSKKLAWSNIYRGYRSAVDFPTCHYWRDLSEHYPHAKFILTTRDPDEWYDSVVNSIYPATKLLVKSNEQNRLVSCILNRVYYAAPKALDGLLDCIWPLIVNKKTLLARIFNYVDHSIWRGQFEDNFRDKEYAQQKYIQHINDIKSAVPKDRLLVFDVKHGWHPLCDYLAVEVPHKTPFPYLNKRHDLSHMVKQFLNVENF